MTKIDFYSFSHMVVFIQNNQQSLIYDSQNFPGAQPVSMDMRNVNNLRIHKYMVSWKADGTRYLSSLLFTFIDFERSLMLEIRM